MNVLKVVSIGNERTGEPPHTSTAWGELSDEDRAKALKDIAHSENGVQFEFTDDEARKLEKAGLFNVALGGWLQNLLSVKTQTFVDGDKETMIKLLARFEKPEVCGYPDNTVVGTFYPNQLVRNINQILMTGPGPVNQ